MYRIDVTHYGFKLTFEGTFSVAEMSKWRMDSVKALRDNPMKPFDVLIDMSKMGPMFPDVKKELEEGQALYRRMGMRRSAVLTPSILVAKQLRDIAASSKIASNERYLGIDEKDAENRLNSWLTIEDTTTGDKIVYTNPSESELELHATILNRAMLYLRTRKS